MDPAAVKENTEYELPTCAFSAPKGTTDGEEISNHVFQAWSVKTGDGEAQEKQPGDTITITADTTVTALWREAENGEITVTGYEPISTLECDYSSSYLSSYYYNLPTKVTVKLSNGNTVEGVLGSSWSVKEGKMGAGNTVTVRNTIGLFERRQQVQQLH